MATKSLRANATSTLSQPGTAIYRNMTLTSPTVYIEFKTAYATDACGYTVGNQHPGAIIGVDPKSLYSVYAKLDYFVDTLGYGGGTTTFYQSNPFNFHDLSGLAPGPAYEAQPSCWDNGCNTISNDYHPVLVLPSQVRDLDPAFASCGLDWRGAWDPPIALQPAEVLAPVITAVEPKYTQPASPKSTVPLPPAETAAAKVTSSNIVPQSTSTANSNVSPSSNDPLAQGSSSPGPSSFQAIATLYPSHVSPEESDSMHDTAPSQRPTGDAALRNIGSRSHINNDAATDRPSDHTAIANSGSIFIDPGVESSSTDESNGMLASPTNALEVMSEALRSLGKSTVTAGFSSAVPIELFGSHETGKKSLNVGTAPPVSTGNSAAQTESISHGGETHTITTGHFGDGTLFQPLENLSTLRSQSILMFTMDGSIIPISKYESSGFQIGSHTLIPGGNPATIGDHVLSAATGGLYEHVQFSLVSSVRVSHLPGSMTFDASVIAVSEALEGAWIVGGHTLTQGGSPLTFGSHTISAGPYGLLRDGSALNGPALSRETTKSSIESSPRTKLPAATTVHDANQHPSSSGQGEITQNRQSPTSTTSSAGKVHTGYYLTVSLCATIFSLIAMHFT
ncbi:hypothetical protein KC345_g7227 [Hortaea werneckii]|nr:hypothetical protein KC345_g7227 [Hortaea werneckii]